MAFSSGIGRDIRDYTATPFDARSVRAFSLKIFFRSSGVRGECSTFSITGTTDAAAP